MKTPVRDILGDWFYYIEGFRSSKMTTADILSHRAGLPYNDPIKIYGYTIRQFVEYVNINGVEIIAMLKTTDHI